MPHSETPKLNFFPASSFKKCNRKEPDFASCVVEAAQTNIPQLTRPFSEVRLPSLDPLEIPSLVIGSGKATVAAEQRFHNCKIYGLDKVKVDKFEFDFDRKNLEVVGRFPEIRKLCDYELNGKILLFNIDSKGPSTIILKNMKATASFDYEEKQKRAKTFIKFISGNLTLDADLVSFRFENVFPGNQAMNENVNKVMNENWKTIFTDVNKGYEEAIGQTVRGLLNNFFSKVSFQEAFE
ncbi:JHBP domain containing protein [Asbolus verrucosus]|uniref:JHBP domain containing protein n=1 Tax=Asbolus verrucosus TaxID=1661398 RepID=A0A482W1F6_ASBVE|nr:JHBP domain containing protein [Asbolus verrucosus]